MQEIKTGKIAIGAGCPCFIIAEAGVNHNGDVRLAKQLIDIACEAGVDAVKFQTWVTEKLVAPSAKMADYQVRNVGYEETQFGMLKKLELTYGQFAELKAYADEKGIIFLSTPDEEDSADFLDQLGVPLFKIGSAELNNHRFLRHIARKGKPIILSTGMGFLGEVEEAVRAIEMENNNRIIILHCVSDYPAKPEDCNLRVIETLRAAFGYTVGFSDHTIGNETAIAAVALGAKVIEKHYTIDKSLDGPDHAMSLDPGELKALVKSIRLVEKALGSTRKQPSAAEVKTSQVVRKRIFALRSIPAGSILKMEDIALYRADSGLDSRYLDLIIGQKVRCDIAENELIMLNMIE